MAIGYYSKGVCYGTTGEAIDAFYSNVNPSYLLSATNSIKLQYLKSGANWLEQKSTITNAGAVTVNYSINAPTNVYGSCTVPVPTFQDVFAVPLASDLQTLWMIPFAVIMICYLSAWAFQQLQNFVESKRH